MPPAEQLLNAPEFTVSELSLSLKRTVEDAFGHVRVRGEISGFRGAHSSGHCYFALKDESAKIEAVIWKGVHSRMRFKPQEGLEVIATGKLTTYPGSSKYQIVIEALEPAGIGALMALMEERKKKLAAEGLFDEARKQLLPWLPEVIGVVTSPTGAVIRDILHRLEDRFPRRVLVWPVKVQGDGSAEQVAAAIRGFNALSEGGRIPRPDVLIVARGGGSLEDLWSFNEEIVVRAAAESMIPLISAVGHETDITLIDFVADKRAPTPTAAAEMAVPVRSDLFVEVGDLARRTRACWQRAQESRRSELRAAARALPAAGDLLAIPRQRLDSAGASLPRCLKANTHAHFRRFTAASSKLTLRVLHGQISQADHRLTVCGERLGLSTRSLLRRRRDRFAGLEVRLRASKLANAQAQRNAIARQRERTHRLTERAQRALVTLLHRLEARVENSGKLLSALSYRSVLARGFALVRDEAGHPVHAADAIGPGARIEIEFADGRVGATADADRAAPAERRAPAQPKPAAETKPAPRRLVKPVDQGSLF
ncbi:exodeoxyribonuclease VII large subunit [Bradyrhizobium sp. IC3069]|uniref:exodeoxyribonuclease VII large subunit n=1 Tax=unclassified Bradyrhizobium TaxID=2631580 RepID=UPI001CD2552B|nr:MULTISPECIES: exodeoxyribonuclease VII large subunit [unclassified Bradyrhizobium]MCA1363276.1 exodeoxyribonuclease VII large subunit [Bradyrhizobium sp. IC4059]MCA1520306.1 exodeoxyribonuclease VII large subunit [Bradyrhizobium sp. IC3069]